MKTAIISGICGMDASHLADLLLANNYKVIGFYRRSSTDKFDRIKHLMGDPNFSIEEGDLTDSHYISSLIKRVKPTKFFNAAAQSHVGTSFKQPHLTFQVNTTGVLNILEAIRTESPETKLVQFCTSEMWGNNIDEDKMQRETTRFEPRSPYAVSKMAAFDLVQTYREAYGLFACSSICHNHTGPRRGDNFVEKKIVNWVTNPNNFNYIKFGVALPKKGDQYQVDYFGNDKMFESCINPVSRPCLKLGNINTYRDFTHSKDCMRAVWLMSEMAKPKDYVIASGRATCIKDILSYVFGKYGKNYEDFIEIDPELYRPAEVEYLCGDSSLIRKELKWQPQYTLEDILTEMLDEQIKIHSDS
jgi:GDPmannose 4,6-dehydratase